MGSIIHQTTCLSVHCIKRKGYIIKTDNQNYILSGIFMNVVSVLRSVNEFRSYVEMQRPYANTKSTVLLEAKPPDHNLVTQWAYRNEPGLQI